MTVLQQWQLAAAMLLAVCLYLLRQNWRHRQVIVNLSHDPVTSLPFEPFARELIFRSMQRASQNWKYGVYVFVIFTDARGLKKVNAACGQEGGDIYLRAHARRLTDLVRFPDVVFRRGGGSRADELFAVIVAPGPAESAVRESRLPQIIGQLGASTVAIRCKNGKEEVFAIRPHVAVASRYYVKIPAHTDVRVAVQDVLDSVMYEADVAMDKANPKVKAGA